MINIKFVVRVSRGVARAPAYVQRIDPSPVQMTTNRKLALMMGRLTAEDAVKSIQHSGCSPELVPMQVAVSSLLRTNSISFVTGLLRRK